MNCFLLILTFCHLTQHDRQTLAWRVQQLREHRTERLHWRYRRNFLHMHLSYKLALENASENGELVGKFLAEFVYEPRGGRCVVATAIGDRDFSFERDIIVFVTQFVERTFDERFLRDEVLHLCLAQSAAQSRLVGDVQFREMNEHGRRRILKCVFKLVYDHALFCFCFCHITNKKDLC